MLERMAAASLFLPADALNVEDFARAGAPIDFTRPALQPAICSFSPAVERRIDGVLSELDALGATILYPFHPAYPVEFYELEKPPLFLSCLGDAGVLRAPCRIAIVGSRELSTRTERWMDHHLPLFLGRCPSAVIVSGGARGADQVAHFAAVRARKPTIVFLPSGLGRIFPPDLRDWITSICETGGVIVSAEAPDESIRRRRFEARNRLIVAMTQATFVAEASRRSGSSMTARLAIELGREVATLPAFPGEVAAQGNLDLLVNGATLIRDADDLVTIANRISSTLVASSSQPQP